MTSFSKIHSESRRLTSTEIIITFMTKVINKKQSDFLFTYPAKTYILVENKQNPNGGYHEAFSKMSSHTLRQKRVRQ